VFNTTQTASCNGGADGTITVNVTAGEALTNTMIQALSKHVFTGLSEGTAYVARFVCETMCKTFGPITITGQIFVAIDLQLQLADNNNHSYPGGNGGYLYNFNGLGIHYRPHYTVQQHRNYINYGKDAKVVKQQP
jgi:hypothetical protein